MKNKRANLFIVVFAVMIAAALPVAAQEGSGGAPASYEPVGTPSRPAVENWGTVARIDSVIQSAAFEPMFDTTTFTYNPGTLSRSITGGPGYWMGAVSLPAGASVERIEIQGCDKSATGSLVATLYSGSVSGSTATETNHGTVASTGSTLCGFWGADLTTPPPTVDNFNRAYMVQVIQNEPGATLSFQAVRLYYKLQVSPAPGSASFIDVPVGSALHQYVQALFASGITAGCGGGNFCPNEPVTRGQMAVFLAKALGLHWPH